MDEKRRLIKGNISFINILTKQLRISAWTDIIVHLDQAANNIKTMTEKSDGKPDPGWNDPPLFTYDKATAIQASASKKGVSLNKRVAYPMSAKAMSSNAVVSPSPPLLPQMTTPPMASDKSSQESSSNIEGNEFEKLSKTEKLDKVLKNLELLKSGNDDEEICKRIKIMEKMWIDDKLDTQVQSKLVSLTEALCEGDTELADRLQMGLMVDYVSQCSSWMSGIRHLINNKRNAK